MQCSSNRALRRANFDSASLHLSRGLAPYGKAETTKNATLPKRTPPCQLRFRSAPSQSRARPMEKQKRPAGRMQALFPSSAVPTSIPLRSISVAGWRPMEKQKRPAGRMQALFHKRTPPCQLRFRFAPSQSRAGALWKSRNDQPEECKHSSTRGLRRANFDSASLHLSRGLAPYGKAETTSRKNASTLPAGRFCFSARLNAITKAPASLYTADSRFLLV